MPDIKARIKPGDYHIVVSSRHSVASIFNHKGEKIGRSYPARTLGQHRFWKERDGDTPPGLYLCGVIYNTENPRSDLHAYGRRCVDLIDLEGQETGNGRAGISLHGGGSALPDPTAPFQGWANTHGCIRIQNGHLMKVFVPLIETAQKSGKNVYLTVEE
jgi:hypothetical protein